MLDGRLRRGEHGAAGEIGHVPVDPAGALCQCGQRGCLETVASGSALAAAWPSGDVPPAQALFAAAAAGDPAGDRGARPVRRRRRRRRPGAQPRRRPAAPSCSAAASPSVGEPLRAAVAAALLDQAAASPFLASLDLAGRLRVVPSDYPVAAVGAALLGRNAEPGVTEPGQAVGQSAGRPAPRAMVSSSTVAGSSSRSPYSSRSWPMR